MAIMVIQVKIGEFRNRLSSFLKKMRQGAEIVISDRETPIGRLIPLTQMPYEKNWQMIDPPKGYKGLNRLAYPASSASAMEELLKERRSR